MDDQTQKEVWGTKRHSPKDFDYFHSQEIKQMKYGEETPKSSKKVQFLYLSYQSYQSMRKKKFCRKK